MALALLFSVLLSSGCGVPVEPLMPTPLLYTDAGIAPFVHVPPEKRLTVVDIMYATNRARNDDWRVIDYSNTTTGHVALGAAAVRIGGPELTWAELQAASITDQRPLPLDIELAGIIERGGFAISEPLAEASLESREFIETVNERVAAIGCDDIFIFVHGAKVNFYNACAFTGQLAHFMGRDMIGIAFAWPTNQDIFSYASGRDVHRAYEAGAALASFIEFLGEHTTARRIHILSWSAGARVVSSALYDLSNRRSKGDSEAHRSRYRIGTVVFAAADVPMNEFLDRLDEVHAMSDRVVVSVSDDDEALVMANLVMGGGTRLGQQDDDLSDEQWERIDALDRLEWIDVSFGKEERGFDIGGHRYWFNHAWCSSDLLLVLRTGLPAEQRGLQPIDGWRTGWCIPSDYPKRISELSQRRRLRDWTQPSPTP